MTRNAVFHNAGSFDDGAPITVFPAAVASVFGRTGAVVATAGDYFGAMPAALTGATQAARFVGATTSGAPVSGTFAVGDVVVARDGKVWVCTVLGSPGTWVDVGGGASVSYATPSIVLGSSAAAGAASTVIRSDSTIAAFDATNPTTQAFGDAAAVGTAAFAARRDHKHAMPATPVTSFAKSGGSALTGAVTISEGSGVTLTPSGNDIAIAASGATAALVLICDSVLGSDQATFDTNTILGGNLPTGYKHLRFEAMLRTDRAALQDPCYLRVNNDTTAGDYESQRLEGNNGTASAARVATIAGIYLGSVNGGTAPTSSFAQVSAVMASYNSTSIFKTALAETFGFIDTANDDVMRNGGVWKSTAAITRLMLFPQVGTVFKAGSQFTLYGMA